MLYSQLTVTRCNSFYLLITNSLRKELLCSIKLPLCCFNSFTPKMAFEFPTFISKKKQKSCDSSMYVLNAALVLTFIIWIGHFYLFIKVFRFLLVIALFFSLFKFCTRKISKTSPSIFIKLCSFINYDMNRIAIYFDDVISGFQI